MNLASPSAPNLFAFHPHHSPGVVGFLYWLCAWADPRHRQASEELHQAGISTLQTLLCGIGGANMDSFSAVELLKHRGPDLAEVCFLRVNGTHALLLSDRECPDDGREGKGIGYWGDDGLSLVAMCCEELPVSWQRVESDHFTLAAWEPDPGMHYLSLAELSAFPVFKAPAHHGSHPVLDDFRRSLLATVEAEQQFREIPPEQWDQQAWRGFYKQAAASFGEKLFLKPLGALKRPFCRITFGLPGMDLILEDQVLRIELSGDPKLETKFREFIRLLLDHQEASLLSVEGFPDHLDVRTETLLIDDLPDEDRLTIRVTVIGNFLIQQNDGRVDLQRTLSRLSAAWEFLIHAYRARRILTDMND